MSKTIAVILAAGKGKRMQSELPKVLHPVAGRPMVMYSIEAAVEATGEKPVLVVGHKANLVKEQVGDLAHYVLQTHQLGTGHAVQQAESVLSHQCDYVLVISADMPLLTVKTLRYLITTQYNHQGPLTILTVIADDPHGFGRVIRDKNQQVYKIVEEAVASPDELAVRELNAGVYCFSAGWLWEALKQIQISPKGEYFLTDVVEIAIVSGQSVQTIILEDPNEVIGINTKEHLLEAEQLLRQHLQFQ